MKYISLFSGIGGLDLGFDRAGMECVAQVEIEKNCLQLLGQKFPAAERFNDVKEFRNYGRSIDLICGGFPCQDLSIAGRRAGLAGERSGLWFEFARVIDELEPRWVVIENVPGLLSSNGGADFAVILRWLVKRGYGVCWRILDAQYFGLAQRRRRVFVVASFGSGRAAQVLFESEGLPGDTPPSREAGQGTPINFEVRTGKEGGGKGYIGQDNLSMPLRGKQNPIMSFMPRKTQMDVYEELSPTMHTGGGGMSSPAVAYGLNSKNNRYDSESQTLVPVAFNIQHNDGGNHKRKDRPNGGLYVNETETALTVGTTDLTAIVWDAQQETSVAHKTKPQTEYTLNKAGQMMYGVRRLTPTECERLQGFPDGWTAGFADTVRYRMLGNAVAVPCAEWLGRRIMEAAALTKE